MTPEILAPAGSRQSFLAAVAPGADAVYCGLKRHSARMAAENFRISDLAVLREAARAQRTRLYVALNTMITSGELADIGRTLDRLQREVQPDALIVQDLAVVDLAGQVGFTGEIHLSTLANVSFAAPLHHLTHVPGVHRVVLPRELSIDEIQAISRACPETLGLEVFVHGALCFAVSGRCYWSSYLGGKSGLRGRCVQPCRRRYTQTGRSGRFFSCQDLSVDVLAKVLRRVARIRAWKIEGRKKGPHYVYHTVQAYRLLRDHGHDAQAKKEAGALLAQALGRRGTHYNFLPQRPQNPVPEDEETGSGRRIGVLKGRGGSRIKPFLPAIHCGSDTKMIPASDAPGFQIGSQGGPGCPLRGIAETCPATDTGIFDRSSGKLARGGNGSCGTAGCAFRPDVGGTIRVHGPAPTSEKTAIETDGRRSHLSATGPEGSRWFRRFVDGHGSGFFACQEASKAHVVVPPSDDLAG